MNKFIAVLILALSFSNGLAHAADAQQFYAQWGLGFDRPSDDKSSKDSIKFAEMGFHSLYKRVDTHLGVGGWTDRSHYAGAKSSAYVHYLAGVETRPVEGMYLSYLVGPAYVYHKDSLLGSNLQISHEMQIGIRDSRNVRIYFAIKHFSNAGLVKPNIGRNFIGAGLEF